jgi:hypothetical protein
MKMIKEYFRTRIFVLASSVCGGLATILILFSEFNIHSHNDHLHLIDEFLSLFEAPENIILIKLFKSVFTSPSLVLCSIVGLITILKYIILINVIIIVFILIFKVIKSTKHKLKQ